MVIKYRYEYDLVNKIMDKFKEYINNGNFFYYTMSYGVESTKELPKTESDTNYENALIVKVTNIESQDTFFLRIDFDSTGFALVEETKNETKYLMAKAFLPFMEILVENLKVMESIGMREKLC